MERGARIYGELAGFGFTSDAMHIADPAPDGKARALDAARVDARILSTDVGHINAHETATVVVIVLVARGAAAGT